MRKIGDEDVINTIRAGQGDKSLRTYASELGITPAYLSDIYHGRRSPGKTVLDHFGIKKTRRTVVEFTFERKKAAK